MELFFFFSLSSDCVFVFLIHVILTEIRSSAFDESFSQMLGKKSVLSKWQTFKGTENTLYLREVTI